MRLTVPKSGRLHQRQFLLKSMENYQLKFGSKVRPSEDKSSEILYNKYDIFKKLYYLYMLSGVLMLLFVIVNIFFEKKALRYLINFFHIGIGFCLYCIRQDLQRVGTFLGMRHGLMRTRV
jgi:hypothetical protein